MSENYEELCDRLSMGEIIKLRELLLRALTRRFERQLALVFSDVVGSTPYFTRFGDEAGRALQQRHLDMVDRATLPRRGRIVDTAGDGAFLCFDGADIAAEAAVSLLNLVFIDNFEHEPDHRLAVRVGVHFGPALTDGEKVSGDSVNFAARISTSAEAGQIRLSKPAFLALQRAELRSRCHMLGPALLKGIARPVDLFALAWRDPSLFPASVVLETGEHVPLPDQDVISFGRLKEQNGVKANDIVLEAPDPAKTQQISRWHFELRRKLDGFVLKPLSRGRTEVDGQAVETGSEARVVPGTVVRVGEALTLTFLSDQERPMDGNATAMAPLPEPQPPAPS